MRKFAQTALRVGPVGLVFVVLAVLVILPVGTLIYASLVDEPPRPGAAAGSFTLDNYRTLFSAANFEAMRNSLALGIGATALALFIGTLLAWLAARTDTPGRSLVQVAGVVPLFMSALVGALAWSLVASPEAGYINLALEALHIPITVNINSIPGMIFVLGLYYAPYPFLLLYSSLAVMNPELEEAAEVHGGNLRTTIRHVTFPLMAPALVGAGILTFVLILDNFPVPQILGSGRIPTLPTSIFRFMTGSPTDPNAASALGVQLLVIMSILVYVQFVVLRGRSYTTVTGKGFRPKTIKLGKARWLGFAFALGYLVVAVGIPYFALIQSSLRSNQYLDGFGDLFASSGMNLDSFRAVLDGDAFTMALKNSLKIGVWVALIGGVLHFTIGYMVYRAKVRGRRFLEYLAMLPMAVPALVIGMGFLWSWMNLPVPVYGTVAILVMAYVTRFMPQGYQGVVASIRQLHPDLEDSALVSGAGRIRAILATTLPLIKSGVFATMALLFIMSMRELTTSIFLFTRKTRVLSIVLYERWEGGRWPEVAAISLLYSSILLVVTAVGWKWLNRSQGT